MNTKHSHPSFVTVSMANRVAVELNTESGNQVGHQVRYDSSSVDKTTRIKFMTDGILLREIQQDFLLLKYSCLILDEVNVVCLFVLK
jgi:ATP-dependent RNA helicase DHX37/DHR1